jgi:hypothetical protein
MVGEGAYLPGFQPPSIWREGFGLVLQATFTPAFLGG